MIKELTENALDAGATRIEITATNGGRTLRVADNGTGMDRDNAALAFHNHATSKISDDADLSRLDTLGFRGEALASIASISKLTCLTRTTDTPTGLKIIFDAECNPLITDTGCAPGTVMEVDDLFYNTPARLKFLRRPATELSHITETVENLALSNPGVQFTLTINEKQTLKTSGSGQLKITTEEVFGFGENGITLIPVEFHDNEAGLHLSGFVSSPGVTKNTRRWIVPFINKRSVKCQVISKALERGFESLIEHGRYPVAILFLQVPKDEVDVNVHPTKKEVRYTSNNTIFSFIKQGVRQALEANGFTAWSATPDPTSFVMSTPRPLSNTPPPDGSARDPFSRAPAYSASPQETMNLYTPLERPASPQQTLGGVMQPRVKVIGQLFNTYILIETPQGLMVVDQHIASERTLFERFSLNMQAQTPSIQNLLTALPLPITPTQAELLETRKADFAKLGFSYTVAHNTVTLTTVPLLYQGREPKHLFETLLETLSETGEMKLDLDNLIATLSCHAAVRAGDILSNEQMYAVVNQWLACTLPWTCPHGRPIAHTIAKEELNKFFHRPSLPANAGSF